MGIKNLKLFNYYFSMTRNRDLKVMKEVYGLKF